MHTLILMLAAAAGQEAEATFFESKIRPVLVQHCYSCHSAEALANKKLQGGLFVDSAAGLLKGGDSGPALAPGKSAESQLVKALRHDGLEMPPAGKLPDAVIADFVHWIDRGAYDPRTEDTTARPKREINLAEGRQFWSFQPLQRAEPPPAADSAWNGSAIDRFLAAKHVEQGVRPNNPVAREKLLRRVYFDLHGLPPTPEQIDAFLADSSPNAFEKVVDQLLDSPRYGERWARHWLDVARFAESGGYEFDGFRPGAYHYRDWVIRALNADLPYRDFIRYQLAGDKLSPGYDGVSAVGFLVAGPYPGQTTAKTIERIRYDQLDDMLMTIGGSMLGLTLGCVRCHEHKYDPIPHADYYALAATLARTSHGPVTLDPDPAATAQRQAEHAARLQERRQQWQAFAAAELPKRLERWQRDELPKLGPTARWQTLHIDSIASDDTQLNTREGGLVVVDGPRRKDSDRYVLTARTYQTKLAGLRLDAFAAPDLPNKGPGLGGDGSFALGDFTVTAKSLDPASTEPPVKLKLKPILAAFAEEKQPLSFAVDDNPGTAWRANADPGKDNAAILEIENGLAGFAVGTELKIELKFAGPGLGRFRLAITSAPGTVTWAGEQAPQHLGELRAILAAHPKQIPAALHEPLVRWLSPYDADADRLRVAVDELQRSTPRPPLTDVYSTVAGGQDVFVLRRGEVDNKQGPAAPGFLQVLDRRSTPPRNSPASSSAAPSSTAPSSPTPMAPATDPRVALADWLVDVDHGAGPLVARVMANRLWLHHFGEGLVATPNDFGFQGERPTHPELLDWLAAELIAGGWKLKPLHKKILLTAAYQQGGETSAENLARDPQNRLLWHYRPRRLEAEAIRDALLAVGGSLDLTTYGPSVLDNSPRRSVYLRVKRSELIPIMTLFDAPEPTQSIGERTATTVPTQALALLNAPFVRTQAEKLAQRVRPAADAPTTSAIDAAYRLALGRLPSSLERDEMTRFLESQTMSAADPAARDKALVEMCHLLLCLNEFVYID